jgi:hypothetical protein
MSSLQRRIATVSDTTANLIVQLRELDRLREQVREALLAACRTEVFSRVVTSVRSPAIGKLTALRTGSEAILGLLNPSVGSLRG